LRNLTSAHLKISTRKLNYQPGMMVHLYNPRYLGGRGKRTEARGKKVRETLFEKNKLKQNELGLWLRR
jgi:hypothetical protein